jgi:hypothetical protein
MRNWVKVTLADASAVKALVWVNLDRVQCLLRSKDDTITRIIFAEEEDGYVDGFYVFERPEVILGLMTVGKIEISDA